MKSLLSLFVLAVCLLTATAASATTWYVRADGGTRFSANASSGQCDGQADAPYPGSGVNQHCAFNDYRFLWDDQNTYGVSQWVIAGGDTVILDNTKPWRVGFDQGLSPNDAWCWGGGGPYGCTNPTVPAGTAQNHTRILGRNYAGCSTGNNQPDPTQMTQIFGGFGLQTPLNLAGAQFVDVQCIEVTRHSQCITHGIPAYPASCSSYFPIDDYDSDGIQTDTNTHDVLLQDMWIHGHTDRGIIGSIGGLVTANRINIDTNGMAGWDFDPGNGTGSPNGALKVSYSTIQWSGCNQEYPAVDPIPVISCYSQSTGGYGDGVGTPVTNMVSVAIDHSIFRYNTQDGEDFGHILNANSLSITDSASYANNGGQWKWSGFGNVTFANNLGVANCLRMSQPLAGAPSTYNAHLADFCRANDAMSFNFNNNASALITNNTLITYAPTTFDIQCYDSVSCANTTLTMSNNIVLGYANPTTWNMGGQTGGVGGFCGAGCNGSTLPLGTFNRENNLYAGVRGSCIANQVTDALKGSSNGESCADPQFNNEPTGFSSESSLDGFDFSLSASSPAKLGGTPIPGLTADYTGAPRGNPPSQGALEFLSPASLNNLLTWGATPAPVPTPTPPAVAPTAPMTPTAPTAPVAPTAPTAPVTPPTTPTAPVTTTPTTPVAPTAPATPVGPVPTQISLSLTQGAGLTGKATLKARVEALAGSKTPTGAVIVFTTDNTVLTIGGLDSSGVATWTVPARLDGKSVYAAYPGNDLFGSSTSPVLVPPVAGGPF